MATVFKTFLNDDIKSTRTLLHEAIPLTGALCSGTYGTWPNGGNIKNYSHGMFQSVFDYPYLSSSANHIFDLTIGVLSASNSVETVLASKITNQRSKKINIYNQMASVLMGYDTSGSAIPFDNDGDLAGTTTDKMDAAIFINFSRLLQKDEIKKGSFQLSLGTTDFYHPMNSLLTITDTGSLTSYKVNGTAGEYGILGCSRGGSFVDDGGGGNEDDRVMNFQNAGLIFYQAGVAVLSASVFQGVHDHTYRNGPLSASCMMEPDSGGGGSPEPGSSISGSITGSTIQATCDAIRRRIFDMSFNNTTELNSTIHFCRINSSDFNYSSNPSYLSQSQIRVKNSPSDPPVSYMTAVGLYSADNELLAVAKMSEPLKKDPTNEMIVRVRLDY